MARPAAVQCTLARDRRDPLSERDRVAAESPQIMGDPTPRLASHFLGAFPYDAAQIAQETRLHRLVHKAERQLMAGLGSTDLIRQFRHFAPRSVGRVDTACIASDWPRPACLGSRVHRGHSE
jgi:hypothetical protein